MALCGDADRFGSTACVADGVAPCGDGLGFLGFERKRRPDLFGKNAFQVFFERKLEFSSGRKGSSADLVGGGSIVFDLDGGRDGIGGGVGDRVEGARDIHRVRLFLMSVLEGFRGADQAVCFNKPSQRG